MNNTQNYKIYQDKKNNIIRIDKTLTIPGQAADAKITGDIIKQAETKLKNVKATVDDQIGEPYVEVVTTDHDITLNFHNLKGDGEHDEGQKGGNEGQVITKKQTGVDYSFEWKYPKEFKNVLTTNPTATLDTLLQNCIDQINNMYTKSQVDSKVSTLDTKIATKQNVLVSGSNIKTINSQSLLGSGDIQVGGNVEDVKVNGTSVVTNKVANVTVPTKTSDLQNDSGYITSTEISGKADKTYVDDELNKKADKTTVNAKADKTYVDSKLADKSDIGHTHNKLVSDNSDVISVSGTQSNQQVNIGLGSDGSQITLGKSGKSNTVIVNGVISSTNTIGTTGVVSGNTIKGNTLQNNTSTFSVTDSGEVTTNKVITSDIDSNNKINAKDIAASGTIGNDTNWSISNSGSAQFNSINSSSGEFTTLTKSGSSVATENYVDNLVNPINEKIPQEATSTNKLADKAYVDDKVASSSGKFIGSFAKVTDLPTSSTTETPILKNDYAIVRESQKGSSYVDRYKVTKVENNVVTWSYEFSINASEFTQAQWDAINSGVTSGKVGEYGSHIANESIHVTSEQKTSWDDKYTKSEVNEKLAGKSNIDHIHDWTGTTIENKPSIKKGTGNNAVILNGASSASAKNSTALGSGTSATKEGQVVVGTHNYENDSFIAIVGNGTSSDNKSNAVGVDTQGNVFVNADIKFNCDNELSGGTSLETTLNGKQNTLVAGEGITIDPTTNTISVYSGIKINSFNTNKSTTIENGNKVSNPTYSWSYTGTPTSQKINDETLDILLREKQIEGDISTSTTVTLWCKGQKGEEKTSNIVYNFVDGLYYGVDVQKTSYDSAFIKSLTKKLQGSRYTSFTAEPGTTGDKYVYFCLPDTSTYGEPSFKDLDTGFIGGFTKQGNSIEFENDYGVKKQYSIYRSDNKNLGKVNFQVL